MTPDLKVLCVDDNREAAQCIGRLLAELAGYEVQVCHDGPSALATAEWFHPDVCVLDLAMPGMDGDELAVQLCERGVRSFEDSTRNMLDMSAVPNVKGQSHLPIIVDPSHATGRPDLIPSMCRASVAAGADGVHVEVHNCPEKALSDGPQALLPGKYREVMAQLRRLAEVMGKSIPGG